MGFSLPGRIIVLVNLQQIWGLMRAVDCPKGKTTWLSSSWLFGSVWLAALYSLFLFLFLPESFLTFKDFPSFSFISLVEVQSAFSYLNLCFTGFHRSSLRSTVLPRSLILLNSQFRLKTAQHRKDAPSFCPADCTNFLFLQKEW